MKLSEPPPRLDLADGYVPAVNPSDERHTPRWVFDALGLTFDLDPAAPAGGPWHVPCRAYYDVTADGLAQPWHGLVWLNPPYSRMTPWADRMLEHRCGVMLAPLSPETRWCIDALAVVDALIPLPQVRFHAETHTARHVSFGVMLYGFGDEAVTAMATAELPAFVRAA